MEWITILCALYSTEEGLISRHLPDQEHLAHFNTVKLTMTHKMYIFSRSACTGLVAFFATVTRQQCRAAQPNPVQVTQDAALECETASSSCKQSLWIVSQIAAFPLAYFSAVHLLCGGLECCPKSRTSILHFGNNAVVFFNCPFFFVFYFFSF